MRTAITIAFPHDAKAKPVVLAGPEVPILEQKKTVQEFAASREHGDYQRVEFWLSDAGKVRHHRLTKPVPKPEPKEEKPKGDNPEQKPSQKPAKPATAKAAAPKPPAPAPVAPAVEKPSDAPAAEKPADQATEEKK